VAGLPDFEFRQSSNNPCNDNHQQCPTPEIFHLCLPVLFPEPLLQQILSLRCLGHVVAMNFNSAVVFFEPLPKCLAISFAGGAAQMTSIEIPFNAGKETVLSQKRCSSFPDLVRVIG